MDQLTILTDALKGQLCHNATCLVWLKTKNRFQNTWYEVSERFGATVLIHWPGASWQFEFWLDLSKLKSISCISILSKTVARLGYRLFLHPDLIQYSIRDHALLWVYNSDVVRCTCSTSRIKSISVSLGYNGIQWAFTLTTINTHSLAIRTRKAKKPRDANVTLKR